MNYQTCLPFLQRRQSIVPYGQHWKKYCRAQSETDLAMHLLRFRNDILKISGRTHGMQYEGEE